MTMEPELGEAVRAAAARSGVSVSRWLSDAAEARLRNDLLGLALDHWEREDGAFTGDELAAAADALRLDVSSRSGSAGDEAVA